METRDPGAPWGTTRMAPYAETGTVPLRTPVIDPETQIAVVIDEHGRTVELHNHQTSSSTSNSTSTSSADSYDSDSSSDSDTDH
ncbi:putative ATP-grasp-modified RiPP [Streptomyces sp. ME19-01-6]|uniref:putative ATP-grasp-modified RiPP n=1 Tax=Streptomyces sp. ME19-01-6 TaxID=3028686 RepID=UPI0029AB271A|nr:putative ATP-grasp-modified RiPP [Streptomyces sp. ME19-01-6]MDX3231518.1 putative ATP-grasp-modified RiPP [Streptomyces sp. ME19-01-6]